MIRPTDLIGIVPMLALLFGFHSTVHEDIVALGLRLIRTAKADVNSTERKSINSDFMDSVYIRFYLGHFYKRAPFIFYSLVLFTTLCYAISIGISNETVTLFGGHIDIQRPVVHLQRIFIDLISFCTLLASLLFYRVTFDERT